MNVLTKTLFVFLILFSSQSFALHVCTMTFNSDDEKKALQSVYSSDPSVTFTELVPTSKDPAWLQKACQSQTKCDILLVSGHFGGLFFGEKTIPTLAMGEMLSQSCSNECNGVFGAKSVYLMGCNTLASKKADHRNIDEYLRVLVGDGFPLENAEMVAAARYADFGSSIENKMRAIFPQAKLIFGFDSTGPKGAIAGPLLKKAFLNSTQKERSDLGASSQALSVAFKGRNARITQADSEAQSYRNLRCALNEKIPSSEALAKAFSPQEIRKNYDAALEMTNPSALGRFLSTNPKSLGEFSRVSRAILSQSSHMLGLQKRIYDLLYKTNVIPPDIHRKSSQESFENFLAGGLDYIRTEQLCFMAETTPQVSLDPEWGLGLANLKTFNGVLASCFERQGFKQNLATQPLSTITSCLLASKYTGDDWGCLTALNGQLTIEACLAAAQRNTDVENSDDMRWYCWDRLREQGRINQAQCLALSKSMNILGNRIKSNWNCLNYR